MIILIIFIYLRFQGRSCRQYIYQGRDAKILLNNPALLPADSASFNGYINLFWYFSRSDMQQLRKLLVCNPPYDAPRTGVFACRSPVRPNPIGLTTVKVRRADSEAGIIAIDDIDAFEGTPLLAFEAYEPGVHRIDNAELPRWLTHWPKEAGVSLQAAEVRISPSDIRRLESELPLEEAAENKPRSRLQGIVNGRS